MKNFRTLMAVFAVSAALTIAFGALMYRAFVNSVRFYGYQPGDLKVLITVIAMFSAGVGISGYLLTKALDWLILVRRFRKEFGFEPPSDHVTGWGGEVSVRTTLDSIRQHYSAKKWVSTALLAEKFGFSVKWPAELREEYARAHR